jgi:glycosyltransferase involved in cell wall biosynthesis
MRITMLLHKSVEFDSRVRREASALAAADHAVTVVELAPVAPDATRLDGFRRRSCLPPAWVRRRLPTPVYRALFLVGFIRAARASAPDVIHAHDAPMLVPGWLAARLTGARLVYDSHELATGVAYHSRLWLGLVAAVERLTVPRAAAVLTVSDGIADRLGQRYRPRRPPVVVRNVSALDPTGRGALRATLGIGPEQLLILHQGAPAPGRGCEPLVAATARLPGVWLAFVGAPDPGYEPLLRAEIARHGVGDRVRLVPTVALGSLLAHTAEADVGVTLLQDTCENHRLALPNKLFEYIAAGVPVVASALPEMQRIVAGYGIGWCVPPGDVDALASALAAALGARTDPELTRCLRVARSELNWERERHRLLAVYEELASEPPPGVRRRPRVPR